jgi:hypothetical protein
MPLTAASEKNFLETKVPLPVLIVDEPNLSQLRSPHVDACDPD